MIDYILNTDIKDKIQKNILDYQVKLSKKATDVLSDKNFDHWLETKQVINQSFVLDLEFSNLYFNFQINKLLATSQEIKSRYYKKISESWIDDFVEKFNILQSKYDSNEKMTQEEFENFFECKK